MSATIRRAPAHLVAAVVLLGGWPAGAEQVAGSFEHSERGKIEPRYAAAFPVRASWDPEQRGIQVMLTPVEIDAEAAALSADPGTQVVNQAVLRGTDYVVVNVWDDGDVAVNGNYDRGNAQFILNTRFGLESKIETQTEERIAGRIWSAEPVETSDGETYSIDLTFDATIARPPPSNPLPEGGGEPGEAFAALARAVLAKSWESVRPLLTPEQIESAESGWAETDEERVEHSVPSLHAWVFTPSGEPSSSVVVRGGSVRADGLADLDVAVKRDGGTLICQARMRRSGERWFFESMTMLTVE
jgi:hypothetical protein